MNKYKIFLSFGLVFLFCLTVSAQVEVSGLVDVEVSVGGADSDFGVNEIASDYKDAHLAINQFNLFVFSQINEDFYVDARLQFDTWGSGQLNPLRLALAEVVWSPPGGSVQLSFGRFVNPFGLYPQRQLSVQNLFVNTPLAYGYALNVNNQQGVLYYADSVDAVSSYSGLYGEDAINLTTISYAGYSTGAMLSWLIIPEVVNLDIAVTNTAISSQRNYSNRGNFGGIARIGFQPAIFWQQGISFSYGGFMERSAEADTLGDLSDYTQTVFGTDLVLAFGHFELSGEFVYSTWKAPVLDQDTVITNPYGKVKGFDLNNYSYYIDLKYEPSFVPGSYLAVRFEELRFEKYKEGGYYNTPPDYEFVWGNDVRRLSAAIGYKFSPEVQIKIAFSDQSFIDSDIDIDAYTVRSILSASF